VAVGGWQCSIEGVFGRYDDLYLPIHGRHQVDHLATAIATSEMFVGRELDHDALAFAVGSISAPGRLEVVGRQPLVIVDGAHNPQGFRGLAETLVSEFPAMNWELVLGARGERDIADLVAPLRGLVASVSATAPRDGGAISAELVAKAAGESLDVSATTFPDVLEAVRHATQEAGAKGGVVVAGSLYLIGEVRREYEALGDRSRDVHVRIEAERDFDQESEYEDDQTE